MHYIIPKECVGCLHVQYLPNTTDNMETLEGMGIVGWCKRFETYCFKLTEKCDFILGDEAFQKYMKNIRKNIKEIVK